MEESYSFNIWNVNPQELEDYIDIFDNFNIKPKDAGISDYHNILYGYIKAVLKGSKIDL